MRLLMAVVEVVVPLEDLVPRPVDPDRVADVEEVDGGVKLLIWAYCCRETNTVRVRL